MNMTLLLPRQRYRYGYMLFLNATYIIHRAINSPYEELFFKDASKKPRGDFINTMREIIKSTGREQDFIIKSRESTELYDGYSLVFCPVAPEVLIEPFENCPEEKEKTKLKRREFSKIPASFHYRKNKRTRR